MATSNSAASTKLSVRSPSSPSHTIEGTEANPLIEFPSHHHIADIGPISPTPTSLSIEKSNPQVEPLKAPSVRNLFLFSHAGYHLNGKQLIEHVDRMVMSYVTQHNNLRHNHDKALPPQAITSTLRTLRSQLHISDLEIDGDSYDAAPPMKFVRSDDGLIPVQCDTAARISEEKTNKPIPKGKWCTHSSRALWPEFLPSSALLHHASYSITPDKCCGKLEGSVRQDWNTIESDLDEERNWEELKPHWFELFFDLMFVAAIIRISTEGAYAYEHGDYIFIYSVFPQFGLLILCWLEQVLYHSRFRMDQKGDAFLRFLYMTLVLLMGLSIGDMKNEISQNLFLLSYMFTKLIMCIMFIKSSFIARARTHSLYMIVENVVSIVCIIVIDVYTMSDDDNEYDAWPWFWCAVYSALFIYSWFHMVVLVYLKCIRDLGVNIPINVPHIAERMGAFVLILLGETIISIMAQHVELTRKGIVTSYAVTVGLFIIVYSIGKLYFESQPSEHELHYHNKSHAMSTSIWRARIYKWFHILLFFALLALGLASKITVHGLEHYSRDNESIVILGIACCVICCAINVIRLTHPFNYNKEHPYLVVAVWCVRVLCMIVMVAILFANKILNHAIIAAVYIFSFIIQIFIDFEARKRLIIAKKVDKDKGLWYFKKSRGIDKEITVTNEMSCIGAF